MDYYRQENYTYLKQLLIKKLPLMKASLIESCCPPLSEIKYSAYQEERRERRERRGETYDYNMPA